MWKMCHKKIYLHNVNKFFTCGLVYILNTITLFKNIPIFDDRVVCVLFVTGYIILFLPSKLTKIDD